MTWIKDKRSIEMSNERPHMIAVGVFHTLKDMTVEFGDPSGLVFGTQKVNHLPGTSQNLTIRKRTEWRACTF